jgi:nucleoside-diphosphate-sugar epimerase
MVTGGSGFIGSNLIEYFSLRGDEVINVDILYPRNANHELFWRSCDLLDVERLRLLVREFSPDVLFHMAARTDLDGCSVEDYAANTVGVENLITAVEGVASLRRLIFASSRLVCRIGYEPKDEFDYCPTTAYGESKVIGETLVRDSVRRLPCPALIVRPTSIWGPWFDVPYKTFFLTIARGHYVHPGSARILKSFGFVGNTIHELVRLMDTPEEAVAGKTFYLADYPPIDVAEMANTIQRVLGVRSIKRVPVGALRAAAWVGDALKVLGWRNPPLTSFRLDNLLTPMVHDLEPLEAVAGELPHTMEEGVRITVAWLRAQGEVS